MMDIQRLILYAIFFSSAFFLWSAWQQEHAPPPQVAQQAPVNGTAKDAPPPSASTAPPTASPTGAAPGEQQPGAGHADRDRQPLEYAKNPHQLSP